MAEEAGEHRGTDSAPAGSSLSTPHSTGVFAEGVHIISVLPMLILEGQRPRMGTIGRSGCWDPEGPPPPL